MIYTDEEIMKFIKMQKVAPKDMNYNSVAYRSEEDTPWIFKTFSETENSAYKEKKLNSFTNQPKKTFSTQESDMWGADLNVSDGMFDAQGHFISTDEIPAEIFWLIKDGIKIKGPLTREELLTNNLEGKMIKRSIDKEFVAYDSKILLEDHFIKDPTKELKPEDTEEKKCWSENCVKTKKLLERRKCNMSVIELEKEIRGLTKQNARNKIVKITNLNEVDALDVLNFLLTEAKKEICSDIDKDGFTKSPKKERGKK